MKMKQKKTINHPTLLFVGAHDSLVDHVEAMMQQQFCANNDNDGCYCGECQKITNRQHPFIVHISPEKNYTIKDIAIVFDKIRFALDDHQTFFFILEKIETLTPATANRLLKILEEPPTGYHFLLLTSNLSSVLPTIQSRSLISTITSTSSSETSHPVLHHFFKELDDPLGFEQVLRTNKPTDSESITMLGELIENFSKRYKDALKNNNHEDTGLSKLIIDFLYKQLKKPPQSGSSDIFWKHVYLSFPRK